MTDDPKDTKVTELQETIATAEALVEDTRDELETRTEEVAVEQAAITRKAKGIELARRTFELRRERLARDTIDLPELKAVKDRKRRTGFALLKSNAPSAFNDYVSQAIEMIEDYDGEITDVTYALGQPTHYVSLFFTSPADLKDMIDVAIVELKRLNSA